MLLRQRLAGRLTHRHGFAQQRMVLANRGRLQRSRGVSSSERHRFHTTHHTPCAITPHIIFGAVLAAAPVGTLIFSAIAQQAGMAGGSGQSASGGSPSPSGSRPSRRSGCSKGDGDLPSHEMPEGTGQQSAQHGREGDTDARDSVEGVEGLGLALMVHKQTAPVPQPGESCPEGARLHRPSLSASRACCPEGARTMRSRCAESGGWR